MGKVALRSTACCTARQEALCWRADLHTCAACVHAAAWRTGLHAAVEGSALAYTQAASMLCTPSPHAGRGAAAAAQRLGPNAQELQLDGCRARPRCAPFDSCLVVQLCWCCVCTALYGAAGLAFAGCTSWLHFNRWQCQLCRLCVPTEPCMLPRPIADASLPTGAAAAAAALGFGRAAPRSLPVPDRAGARGMTDSGTPYIATSAGTGAAGSSWGASSLRGASPPAASPVQRLGGRPLTHNLSSGALRGGAQGGSSSPVPPRPGDFARLRSKTFR